MLATIEAIAERLADERRLVYRYRTDEGVDGLTGEEGTLLLCTFWLAQALALSGQVDRAREGFDGPIEFSVDQQGHPRLGVSAAAAPPAPRIRATADRARP